MILQRLHLLHFKSIASASCTFSPKVNCFIGLNGMGKTNLLDALQHGMPECSGVALGVDRLVMLALGAESLSEVLAFPVGRA